MTRAFAVFAMILTASAAPAAPGGPMATLPLGEYHCEVPGDATGPAGLRRTDHDFTVVNASSYVAAGQRGTYLLTGNRVAITSGPKKGQQFVRRSDGFLRLLQPNGGETALRCVRQVPNNR